jgi:inner membrane protein
LDNLTHSLIGLVAGDAVAHGTRTRGGALSAGARRGLFVTLAVVGGNLPDADLILPYSHGARDKLSYLLEHRGYTHTLIGCVLMALLMYACVEGWARYKSLVLTSRDQIALFGMALLGTMLHLFMDFMNSYGVHPFWPFNNEWVYGDSVFIIEPIYWIAAAPMFFVAREMQDGAAEDDIKM